MKIPYENAVQLETDIAVIHEQVKNIVKEIEEIKDNHLPHIYERMGKVENKIAYYAGALAVLIVLLRFL